MANEDVTGDLDDRVQVFFKDAKGEEHAAPILESYEFTRSILTQPCAFSVRLGWGGVTKDLLDVLPPRLPVRLTINDTTQLTGNVDDVEASGEVGATEISLHGRDALAPLHDAFIEAELSLANATYAQLVEKAVTIIENLGARVIGPAEVRQKLGLTKRAPLAA